MCLVGLLGSVEYREWETGINIHDIFQLSTLKVYIVINFHFINHHLNALSLLDTLWFLKDGFANLLQKNFLH